MKMTSALRNTTLGGAKAQPRFSAFAQFGILYCGWRIARLQPNLCLMWPTLDVAPEPRVFCGPTLTITCTGLTSINRFLRWRASEPANPADRSIFNSGLRPISRGRMNLWMSVCCWSCWNMCPNGRRVCRNVSVCCGLVEFWRGPRVTSCVSFEFNLPLYSWYPDPLKRYCERLAVTTRPQVANFDKYPAVNWFSFYELRVFLSRYGYPSIVST